jgi:hypothetical protein
VSQFFLNPDIKAFPEKANYSQRNAELHFYFQTPLFFVVAFGERQLAAKPFPPTRGELLPTHRFPDYAAPVPPRRAQPCSVVSDPAPLHRC